MEYHVYLIKRDSKIKNKNFDFLSDETLLLPFTDEQFNQLKERLLKYGYQTKKTELNSITFNFKDDQYGIVAILTTYKLFFSSDTSQNGIFEISQTASECIDTGEYTKFDPQDGQWEDIEGTVTVDINLKLEFNSIMDNVIAPLMTPLGYERRDLTFYKTENDLIYLINFQESVYNTNFQIDFFVNCCIHSLEIDKVLGKETNPWLEEHQCWHSKRIENITTFPFKFFSIKLENDKQIFQKDLVKYIHEANQYLFNIKNTSELIEKMVDTGSYDNFELLDYLTKTNEQGFIKRLVTKLYVGYSKTDIWPKAEAHINEIFHKNSIDLKAADLIK